MGYNIRYKLTCTGEDANFDLAVELMGQAEDVIGTLADQKYFFELERVSRQEMAEVMLLASKKYPGILFKVHARGERNEDISDHYYQNGKSADYKAVMTIPPFNPHDMK